MIVFLNGKFVDKKDAKISVFDNGFLYGDGIYETMRTYDGKIFELDEHLKRLKNSSKIMDLNIPWSSKKISSWVKKIIKINKLSNARVSIILTRGEQGNNFTICEKPSLCIFGKEIIPEPEEIYQKGVSAITIKLQRILPKVKSLNLLHFIVAKKILTKKKAYEALLIDEKKFVREGATTNIFMIKNGIFVTPKNDILVGKTRKLIIKLIKKRGWEIQEKDFKVNELEQADEVFLTNRPREIIPVIKLNNKKIGTGKPGILTRKIMEEFQNQIKSFLKKT